MQKINWLALVGGILSLVLIAVSMYVPWWQFTVGDSVPPLAQANFSPVNLNISILGDALTIPLIWAINIATLLSLAAGGIILLIYAVLPAKAYSKKLLDFGYNKPLVAVVLFAVELVILVMTAKTAIGIDVPVTGSALVHLPESMTQSTDVAVMVSAGFGWVFYFAIVVAILCVAARVYHRKVEAPKLPT